MKVVEYDWGADAEQLLPVGGGSAGSYGYDVVICADCVYARASVEPLLASLCQVHAMFWRDGGRNALYPRPSLLPVSWRNLRYLLPLVTDIYRDCTAPSAHRPEC